MKPVIGALCTILVYSSLVVGQNVFELLDRTPDCAVSGLLSLMTRCELIVARAGNKGIEWLS